MPTPYPFPPELNGRDRHQATLSAEELHRICLTAHRLGNRLRLRFNRALLALEETRQHVSLGSPTAAAYAQEHFKLSRCEAFNTLRVTRSLLGLPQLAAAFEAGALSWSSLVEVTRVATAESEGEWLELARTKRFHQLKAEVRDANHKRRTRPRSDRYGLPRLLVRLLFELTPEEAELVCKALAKVRREMLGCLGPPSGPGKEGEEGEEENETGGGEPPERVDNVQALLFLARRALATDPAATPPGRV
ncbi:MAG: hypothetical protein ACREKK_14365, partial [Candidatus Methylomirabilales bacterium]